MGLMFASPPRTMDLNTFGDRLLLHLPHESRPFQFSLETSLYRILAPRQLFFRPRADSRPGERRCESVHHAARWRTHTKRCGRSGPTDWRRPVARQFAFRSPVRSQIPFGTRRYAPTQGVLPVTSRSPAPIALSHGRGRHSAASCPHLLCFDTVDGLSIPARCCHSSWPHL